MKQPLEPADPGRKPVGWSPELQENLLPLVRLVERAQGFALALLQCNVPTERERIVAALIDTLGDRGRTGRILQLESAVDNLDTEIFRLVPPLGTQDVLFVLGFEHSLPSASSASALHRLNMAREKFRELPSPIVLVLPEYALTLLAREAPDFWAWRSGVFEVPIDRERLEAISRTWLEDRTEPVNLSAEGKLRRLAVLQEIFEEYLRSPNGHFTERGQIAVEIAQLFNSLGEWNPSSVWFEKALEAYERVADEEHVAFVCYLLGSVLINQRHFPEALARLNRSLEILERIGNSEGIAAVLFQMGRAHASYKAFGPAKDFLLRALEHYEKLGNRSGVARVFSALGLIAEQLAEIGEARSLYRKSMEISGELGDVPETAVPLFQMANLALSIGDYDQAVHSLRRALELNDAAGNRPAMAACSIQLGKVALVRGDYPQATFWIQKGLAIAEAIGDRVAEAVGQNYLARIAEELGDLVGALEHLQKVAALYERIGKPELLAGVARELDRLLSRKPDAQ